MQAESTTTGSADSPRAFGLAVAGLLATAAAVSATTVAAALAQAAGVGFEIPEGGEAIPLPGFAVVTTACALLGVVLAAAFRRWSGHPAGRFGWTAGSLTAISLIPPAISGADAATVTTLLALHLVAAAIMIPVLVRRLPGRP